MSNTFTVVPVPLVPPDGKHEVVIDLRDPGVIRSVSFVLKRREVNIDLQGAMTSLARGRLPEPEYGEVLTAFVESTRKGPMRARHFLLLGSLVEINVPDGFEARYIGTATSPHTQAVAHVYELVREFVDIMGVKSPRLATTKKEIGPARDDSPPADEALNEAAAS
jgi:hypothetical protein